MKRTRQVAPPSQKPATVTNLPDGEVSSTVSSVSGVAVAGARKLCSQRPQSWIGWALALAARESRQRRLQKSWMGRVASLVRTV